MFEAQFMKKLSNNEAELKRRCLKNKKSRVSAYDSFCIRRVINIFINTYTNTLETRYKFIVELLKMLFEN